MAKNNKYASINFNHIYEKSISTNSSTNSTAKNPSPSPSPSPSYSSASYSAISAPNKSHGRIRVLSRPTPKPKPVTSPASPPSSSQQQPPKPLQQVPDQQHSEPGSDAISLRPLGRTGTGSSLSSPVILNHDKDKELPPSPLISPKPDKFVPPHLRPGFVRKEERPGPEVVRSRDAAHNRWPGHAVSPGGYGEDGRPESGGSRPSSSGCYGDGKTRLA